MKENVEIVQRFTSLMSSRDLISEAERKERLDQVLSLLQENVAFRTSEAVPGHGGDWIGHDGFLKMCQAYTEMWEPPEGVKETVLDAGIDKVVVLLSYKRTARRTGWSTPIKMAEFYTVRDGKIVEMMPYYYDTIGMLEATRGEKFS